MFTPTPSTPPDALMERLSKIRIPTTMRDPQAELQKLEAMRLQLQEQARNEAKQAADAALSQAVAEKREQERRDEQRRKINADLSYQASIRDEQGNLKPSTPGTRWQARQDEANAAQSVIRASVAQGAAKHDKKLLGLNGAELKPKPMYMSPVIAQGVADDAEKYRDQLVAKGHIIPTVPFEEQRMRLQDMQTKGNITEEMRLAIEQTRLYSHALKIGPTHEEYPVVTQKLAEVYHQIHDTYVVPRAQGEAFVSPEGRATTKQYRTRLGTAESIGRGHTPLPVLNTAQYTTRVNPTPHPYAKVDPEIGTPRGSRAKVIPTEFATWRTLTDHEYARWNHPEGQTHAVRTAAEEQARPTKAMEYSRDIATYIPTIRATRQGYTPQNPSDESDPRTQAYRQGHANLQQAWGGEKPWGAWEEQAHPQLMQYANTPVGKPQVDQSPRARSYVIQAESRAAWEQTLWKKNYEAMAARKAVLDAEKADREASGLRAIPRHRSLPVNPAMSPEQQQNMAGMYQRLQTMAEASAREPVVAALGEDALNEAYQAGGFPPEVLDELNRLVIHQKLYKGGQEALTDEEIAERIQGMVADMGPVTVPTPATVNKTRTVALTEEAQGKLEAEAFRQNVILQTGMPAATVNTLFADVSGEQLKAITAHANRLMLAAGAGGGKSLTAFARVAYLYATKQVQNDGLYLSGTRSGAAAMVPQIQRLHEAFKGANRDFVDPKSENFKAPGTTYAVARGILFNEDQKVNGKTAWETLELDKKRYSRALVASGSGKDALSARDVQRSQFLSQEELVKKMMQAHGQAEPSKAKLNKIVARINEIKQDPEEFKAAMKRGAELHAKYRRSDLSLPAHERTRASDFVQYSSKTTLPDELQLYRYQKTLHAKEGFVLHDTQFAQPHHDMLDMLYQAETAAKAGFGPRPSHIVLDEMQDSHRQEYRMIAALAGPQTHIITAGDLSQMAIPTNRRPDVYGREELAAGGHEVAQQTLLFNQRTRSPILQSFANALLQARGLNVEGAYAHGAPQITASTKGKRSDDPTLHSAGTYEEMFRQAIGHSFKDTGIDLGLMKKNLESNVSLWDGVTYKMEPRQSPTIMQTRTERALYRKVFKQFLGEHLGEEHADYAFEQMYTEELPAHAPAHKFAGLLVNEAKSNSLESPKVIMQRTGKWNKGGYLLNLYTMLTRARGRARLYSSNKGLPGQTHITELKDFHGILLPPELHEVMEIAAHDAVHRQNIPVEKLPNYLRVALVNPHVAHPSMLNENPALLHQLIEATTMAGTNYQPAMATSSAVREDGVESAYQEKDDDQKLQDSMAKKQKSTAASLAGAHDKDQTRLIEQAMRLLEVQNQEHGTPQPAGAIPRTVMFPGTELKEPWMGADLLPRPDTFPTTMEPLYQLKATYDEKDHLFKNDGVEIVPDKTAQFMDVPPASEATNFLHDTIKPMYDMNVKERGLVEARKTDNQQNFAMDVDNEQADFPERDWLKPAASNDDRLAVEQMQATKQLLMKAGYGKEVKALYAHGQRMHDGSGSDGTDDMPATYGVVNPTFAADLANLAEAKGYSNQADLIRTLAGTPPYRDGEQGMEVSLEYMQDLERKNPREAAIIRNALTKPDGTLAKQLNDKEITRNVDDMAHTAGVVDLQLSSTDMGKRHGRSLPESELAPLATELQAFKQSLLTTGYVDPMAGSYQDAQVELPPITPDMAASLRELSISNPDVFTAYKDQILAGTHETSPASYTPEGIGSTGDTLTRMQRDLATVPVISDESVKQLASHIPEGEDRENVTAFLSLNDLHQKFATDEALARTKASISYLSGLKEKHPDYNPDRLQGLMKLQDRQEKELALYQQRNQTARISPAGVRQLQRAIDQKKADINRGLGGESQQAIYQEQLTTLEGQMKEAQGNLPRRTRDFGASAPEQQAHLSAIHAILNDDQKMGTEFPRMLNFFMQATAGHNMVESTIKPGTNGLDADHKIIVEHARRLLSGVTSEYRGGNRDVAGVHEMLSTLDAVSSHYAQHGTMDRSHIKSLINVLGLSRREEDHPMLAMLTRKFDAGQGEDYTVHPSMIMTTDATSVPFRSAIAPPVKLGQAVMYMGGGRGKNQTIKEGEEGLLGTLLPFSYVNKQKKTVTAPFGRPITNGQREAANILPQQDWNTLLNPHENARYGLHPETGRRTEKSLFRQVYEQAGGTNANVEMDLNSDAGRAAAKWRNDWRNQYSEPAYTLHTRDGRREPVSLSQIAALTSPQAHALAKKQGREEEVEDFVEKVVAVRDAKRAKNFARQLPNPFPTFESPPLPLYDPKSLLQENPRQLKQLRLKSNEMQGYEPMRGLLSGQLEKVLMPMWNEANKGKGAYRVGDEVHVFANGQATGMIMRVTGNQLINASRMKQNGKRLFSDLDDEQIKELGYTGSTSEEIRRELEGKRVKGKGFQALSLEPVHIPDHLRGLQQGQQRTSDWKALAAYNPDLALTPDERHAHAHAAKVDIHAGDQSKNPSIYTLGYQKEGAWGDMMDAVKEGAVIVDVRKDVTGNIKKGWDQASLQKQLGEQYVHIPELGNVNHGKGKPIQIDKAKEGIAKLKQHFSGKKVVLLCACGNPETCHRTTVATMLKGEIPGLEVHHLGQEKVGSSSEALPPKPETGEMGRQGTFSYHTGDNIFTGGAQTLVNTVNMEGHMGAGLALAMKQKYPEIVDPYRADIKSGKLKLGQPALIPGNENRPHILNFATKNEWKKPSQLEWIEQGMAHLATHAKDMGIRSIAFPKLGTNNGKLDWNDVGPIMAKHVPALLAQGIDVQFHVGEHDQQFMPPTKEDRVLHAYSTAQNKEHRRFSAFNMKLGGSSIEDWYQSSKRDKYGKPLGDRKGAKGKQADHFEFMGEQIPGDQRHQFYLSLWHQALQEQPELFEYAKGFDGYHDKYAEREKGRIRRPNEAYLSDPHVSANQAAAIAHLVGQNNQVQFPEHVQRALTAYRKQAGLEQQGGESSNDAGPSTPLAMSQEERLQHAYGTSTMGQTAGSFVPFLPPDADHVKETKEFALQNPFLDLPRDQFLDQQRQQLGDLSASPALDIPTLLQQREYDKQAQRAKKEGHEVYPWDDPYHSTDTPPWDTTPISRFSNEPVKMPGRTSYEMPPVVSSGETTTGKKTRKTRAGLEPYTGDDYHIIPKNDPRYPAAMLSQMGEEAPTLHARGDLSLLGDTHRIAVSASYKPSDEEKAAAYAQGQALAREGHVTVSNLGKAGILAHKGAIAAGGRSIAVLPKGLHPNEIFPKADRGWIEEQVKAKKMLLTGPVPMGTRLGEALTMEPTGTAEAMIKALGTMSTASTPVELPPNIPLLPVRAASREQEEQQRFLRRARAEQIALHGNVLSANTDPLLMGNRALRTKKRPLNKKRPVKASADLPEAPSGEAATPPTKPSAPLPSGGANPTPPSPKVGNAPKLTQEQEEVFEEPAELRAMYEDDGYDDEAIKALQEVHTPASALTQEEKKHPDEAQQALQEIHGPINPIQLQLEAMQHAIREGKTLFPGTEKEHLIPPASQEQLGVIDDPARHMVIKAGPGSGKTTTLIKHMLNQVSRGMLPQNMLSISTLRSGRDELAHQMETWAQPLLPNEKAYTFRAPMTVHALAHRIVMGSQAEEGLDGQEHYSRPILDALGYSDYSTTILHNPSEKQLSRWRKKGDVEKVHDALKNSKDAFLHQALTTAFAGRSGIPIPRQNALKDQREYIEEVKKYRVIADEDPSHPHLHSRYGIAMAQGRQDIHAGAFTRDATLAAYEDHRNREKRFDFDDQPYLATKVFHQNLGHLIPDDLKEVEGINVDESQDLTPSGLYLVSSLAHWVKNQRGSRKAPALTFAHDPSQSAMAGRGGIPINELHQTIVGTASRLGPVAQKELTENYRSPKAVVSLVNSIVRRLHGMGEETSPVQKAMRNEWGKLELPRMRKSQATLYQDVTHDMLKDAGIDLKVVKLNADSNMPYLDGITPHLPLGEMAFVAHKNDQHEFFEHVFRQTVSKELGEEHGKRFTEQFLRRDYPERGDEDEKLAKNQITMATPANIRSHGKMNVYSDITGGGQWPLPDFYRQWLISLSRPTKQLKMYAATVPFNRHMINAYKKNPNAFTETRADNPDLGLFKYYNDPVVSAIRKDSPHPQGAVKVGPGPHDYNLPQMSEMMADAGAELKGLGAPQGVYTGISSLPSIPLVADAGTPGAPSNATSLVPRRANTSNQAQTRAADRALDQQQQQAAGPLPMRQGGGSAPTRHDDEEQEQVPLPHTSATHQGGPTAQNLHMAPLPFEMSYEDDIEWLHPPKRGLLSRVAQAGQAITGWKGLFAQNRSGMASSSPNLLAQGWQAAKNLFGRKAPLIDEGEWNLRRPASSDGFASHEAPKMEELPLPPKGPLTVVRKNTPPPVKPESPLPTKPSLIYPDLSMQQTFFKELLDPTNKRRYNPYELMNKTAGTFLALNPHENRTAAHWKNWVQQSHEQYEDLYTDPAHSAEDLTLIKHQLDYHATHLPGGVNESLDPHTPGRLLDAQAYARTLASTHYTYDQKAFFAASSPATPKFPAVPATPRLAEPEPQPSLAPPASKGSHYPEFPMEVFNQINVPPISTYVGQRDFVETSKQIHQEMSNRWDQLPEAYHGYVEQVEEMGNLSLPHKRGEALSPSEYLAAMSKKMRRDTRKNEQLQPHERVLPLLMSQLYSHAAQHVGVNKELRKAAKDLHGAQYPRGKMQYFMETNNPDMAFNEQNKLHAQLQAQWEDLPKAFQEQLQGRNLSGPKPITDSGVFLTKLAMDHPKKTLYPQLFESAARQHLLEEASFHRPLQDAMMNYQGPENRESRLLTAATSVALGMNSDNTKYTRIAMGNLGFADNQQKALYHLYALRKNAPERLQEAIASGKGPEDAGYFHAINHYRNLNTMEAGLGVKLTALPEALHPHARALVKADHRNFQGFDQDLDRVQPVDVSQINPSLAGASKAFHQHVATVAAGGLPPAIHAQNVTIQTGANQPITINAQNSQVTPLSSSGGGSPVPLGGGGSGNGPLPPPTAFSALPPPNANGAGSSGAPPVPSGGKGGGSKGKGGGGGGKNMWSNEETGFGHTMTRIGGELQFLGQLLNQVTSATLKQGSDYRQATLGIGKAAGSDGTSGFFNFNGDQNTINAYEHNVLPTLSLTQTAQLLQSYTGSTNTAFSQRGTLGNTTDIGALATIAGMDTAAIQAPMLGIAGSLGQGKSSTAMSPMAGMLYQMYGGNLSATNVTPTLQTVQEILPQLQGLNPMGGSQLPQAMALLQTGLNAGMTTENFGQISSVVNTLANVGSNPDTQQQYQLANLFGQKNLTADTGLVGYQSDVLNRQQNLAQMVLQQNVDGKGLTLPNLQIQISQAQITMDKAQLDMSGLQQQYNVASFQEQQQIQTAEIGPIGADVSRNSYFDWMRNQQQAGYNPLSPETGTQFKKTPTFGLQNEQFYAGIEHQRSMMVLGRSPLLADAAFQENMKYLNLQEAFYKEQLKLTNDQRSFTVVWQTKLLNAQGGVLALQEKQFGLSQKMAEYQQKQDKISNDYLGQQVDALKKIMVADEQSMNGQGPLNSKNIQPADLLSRLAQQQMADPKKYTDTAMFNQIKQLVNGDPAQANTLFQLMKQVEKDGGNLTNAQKKLGSANDTALRTQLQHYIDTGATASGQQSASKDNQALINGGTDVNWKVLVISNNILNSSLENMAKTFAVTSPFQLALGTIAQYIGDLATGVGTLANIMGFFASLKGLGAVTGTGGGGAAAVGGAGIAAVALPIAIAATVADIGWNNYTTAGNNDTSVGAQIKKALLGFIPGYNLGNDTHAYFDPESNQRKQLATDGKWFQDAWNRLFGHQPDPSKPATQPRGGPHVNPSLVSQPVSENPASHLKIQQQLAKNTIDPSSFFINQSKWMASFFGPVGKSIQDNWKIVTGDFKRYGGNINDTWMTVTNDFKRYGGEWNKQWGIVTSDFKRYGGKMNTFFGTTLPDLWNTFFTTTLPSIWTVIGKSISDAWNTAIVKPFSDGFQSILHFFGINTDKNSSSSGNKNATNSSNTNLLSTLLNLLNGGNPGGSSGGGEAATVPAGHPGFITPPVNADFHKPMHYGIHQGVDYAASEGTSLRNFNAGQVTNAGWYPWGGEVDVNIGNGLTERYLHLSSLGVHRGQQVGKGDYIGLTGGGTVHSGLGYWSSGSHSHVQIDQGNINKGINPWDIWALSNTTNISQYYGATKGAQPNPVKSHPRNYSADGGVALSPTTTTVGEGGQPEAIVPLSQLSNLAASIMGWLPPSSQGAPLAGVSSTRGKSTSITIGTINLTVGNGHGKLSAAEKDSLFNDLIGVLDAAATHVSSRQE